MDIPIIEQAKIQARVLVPLIKALQAELGQERANAIVRKTLGDMYRKLGEQWWRAQGGKNLGENMTAAFAGYASGDALDYQVMKQSADSVEASAPISSSPARRPSCKARVIATFAMSGRKSRTNASGNGPTLLIHSYVPHAPSNRQSAAHPDPGFPGVGGCRG